MSARWGSSLSGYADRAKAAVQEAADAVTEAADAVTGALEPRGAPVAAPVNIGFATAPAVPGGADAAEVSEPGGPPPAGGGGGSGDLLALFPAQQVQLPAPEPEPEPQVAEPDGQRVFNVTILPNPLLGIERDKRVYIAASDVESLHVALAERLEVTERFQVWQLDPLQPEGGELRLVESLEQLGDAIKIHLELSDEAMSQRAIDEANKQVFDQIKADMADYMEGAGPTARFDTWLKDSTWMRDTGGARDENGVPLRAAGSVVKDLWEQEASWQAEKRKDREAFEAQTRTGPRGSHEAEITFSLKVCRGGVHAGGNEDILVSSPDHTVGGLVAAICRRMKIPMAEGEELVLSIGNGDMCRVVRSLDQLPQSCPIQLWRSGSGPDDAGGSSSTLIASAVNAAPDASASATALQSQLQLAVTHPDIRRAISATPIEIAFPKEGSGTTPPHEEVSFLFTTHQTELFAQIRANHGIDPQAFFVPMMSLLSLPNPGGKSGASFYVTADGSFFFKSVTRQEFLFLQRMLPELAQRLKLRNFTPEAPALAHRPGDPTPGSSAWIQAQPVAAASAGSDLGLPLTATSRLHYPLGSIALSELASCEASGKMTDETPVWTEGMDEWLPLQQVRSVLIAVLETSVGAPPPGVGGESESAHSVASDTLVEMGFDRAQVDAALELVDGSMDRAVELIASGALDAGTAEATQPPAEPGTGPPPSVTGLSVERVAPAVLAESTSSRALAVAPLAAATVRAEGEVEEEAQIAATVDQQEQRADTAVAPEVAVDIVALMDQQEQRLAGGAASAPAVGQENVVVGSLLPTFMGLYSVCGLGMGSPGSLGLAALGSMGVLGDAMNDTERLVVMANGLPPTSPESGAALSYTFDLKGSTRGRRASASERQQGGAGGLGGVTLKDLDWRERFVTPIVLPPRQHKRLLAMLRADVAMLEAMGVVDYSLLLGVHVTSIEQSRLLPPPPSSLEAGQQTADVEVRSSAEAAAFKANLDAMRREMQEQDEWVDLHGATVAEQMAAVKEQMAAPAVDASLEPPPPPDDDADDDGDGDTDEASGCKWVRGCAVVRRQAEERLVQCEVSVAIVDVLSSGLQAVKVLEALKNKAMYESAASVVPAPEYSSRFMAFAAESVFVCGSVAYGAMPN